MSKPSTIVVSTLCLVALPLAAFAHGPARGGGPVQASAQIPLTVAHVNTRIARELPDGCRFEAAVNGAYRTPDPIGHQLATAPLRDVTMSAISTLTCGGRVLRRRTEQIAFSRVGSMNELLGLLHARLATGLAGSSCAWAPLFDATGGGVHALALSSSCTPEHERVALAPYARSRAIGGGPSAIKPWAIPNSWDFPALPREPIAPPNPPLDYGIPPGRTNK